MLECISLYHISFKFYWRIYWKNEQITNEIDNIFNKYDLIDEIPFISAKNIDFDNIRCRNLFTLLKAFFTVEKKSITFDIFPKNEELDDLSTFRLAFIAIPFFIGHLLLELPVLENRAQILSKAKNYFDEFLITLTNLSHKFHLNVAETRTEKIALAKKDIEIKKKINYLLTLKGDFLSKNLDFQEITSPFFPNYDDDSVSRELTLLLLTKFNYECSTHMKSIDREIELLNLAPKIDINTPSQAPVNIPCVSGYRNTLKNSVFIPPHNLPTITLAECAKAEMEMELGIGCNKSNKKKSSSSSSSNEDINKIRDWDNWKDDHPWGSGNKNRNVG